jgi:hypothetical protein
MVLHVREMIHRVGSYERFNKILKRAIASEGSLNDLWKMQGSQEVRTGDKKPA